jgi:hypothetical protein
MSDPRCADCDKQVSGRGPRCRSCAVKHWRRGIDPMPRWNRRVKKKGDGCWVWIGAKDRDGYGQFRYLGRQTKAHRFIWERLYGQVGPDLQVCHRCDNPSCVRPDHLFVGTATDNNRDKAAKGRSRNQWHKLSPDAIAAIIRALASQANRTHLAREYHVAPSRIWAIWSQHGRPGGEAPVGRPRKEVMQHGRPHRVE